MNVNNNLTIKSPKHCWLTRIKIKIENAAVGVIPDNTVMHSREIRNSKVSTGVYGASSGTAGDNGDVCEADSGETWILLTNAYPATPEPRDGTLSEHECE